MSYWHDQLEPLREVASRLTQFICVADYATGAPLYGSPAGEEIFGIKQSVLDADPWAWQSLVERDDLPLVLAAQQQLLTGSVSVEYRLHHPHRGLRWMRSSAWTVLDDHAQPVRLVALVEDVTDRRATSERIERDARHMRNLLECLPQGVLVYRDRLLYANQTMLDYLGVSADDCIGQPVLALMAKAFGPEEQPEVRRRLAEAVTGQVLPPTERIIRRHDGQLMVAEMTTLTVPFGGEPAQMTIFRDLTERRAIEAKLAMSDRMALLGRMAAGLAHDLNNPLAATLGHMDLAREALPTLVAQVAELTASVGDRADLVPMLTNLQQGLDTVRRHTRAAQQSARQVLGVMRGLDDWWTTSHSETHPVDPVATLRSALHLSAHQVSRSIVIHDELTEMPSAKTSETRLCLGFVSLLTDLATMIERSGDRAFPVYLRGSATPTEVQLRLLANTSLGLEARLLDASEATGLAGAQLCVDVMRANGGDVRAVREGDLSGICLVLPVVAEVANADPDSGTFLVPTGLRRGRVLVIDDDPTVAKILYTALASEHMVEVEHDARRALQRLRAGERFDAVLCDVMMPELSGIDLYRELRHAAPAQADRLVFVTGGAFADDAEAALVDSGRPLITKPFNIKDLRRIIRQVVG